MATGTKGRDVAKARKSETRKHTAMIRISGEAHEYAAAAAGVSKASVADFVSDLILKHAPGVIARESKKYERHAKGESE